MADPQFKMTYAGIKFSLEDDEAAYLANEFLPAHQACDLFQHGTPSKNVDRLAIPAEQHFPSVHVGEFFYPNGASRWAMFRGIASQSQMQQMANQALPSNGQPVAQEFKMRSDAFSCSRLENKQYEISTQLYMLPPRPIHSHGQDGIWLITLVDERYWWQFKDASITINPDKTWDELLTTITGALGVSLSVTPESEYLKPEPDCHWWLNEENAALLLDAALWNLGRVLVRKLDGSYTAMTHIASSFQVQSNRQQVVRLAGGDIGRVETGWRNAILPSSVVVSFPKYFNKKPDPTGQDVPHFVQSRYDNPRQTCWIEDSYGDVYKKTVTLAEAGYSQYQGHQGNKSLHDTAKGFVDSEGGTPTNQADLDALAVKLAQDFYDFQIASSLDEVYPGTVKWEPEGANDLTWTWVARGGSAAFPGWTGLRVQRRPWNYSIENFQHGTGRQAGVGGPSVPQTMRDDRSRTISTTLSGAGVTDSGTSFEFTEVAGFPTAHRWKAKIESEHVLFDKTSGSTTVTALKRGIDGTTAAAHANGVTITQIQPDLTHGVNLTTFNHLAFVYPGEWTKGIQEADYLEPMQPVEITNTSATTILGIKHYQAKRLDYDPQSGSPYSQPEDIWAVFLNDTEAETRKYHGRLVGYSSGTTVRPVYLVDCCDGDPNPSRSTSNYHPTGYHPPRYFSSSYFPVRTPAASGSTTYSNCRGTYQCDTRYYPQTQTNQTQTNYENNNSNSNYSTPNYFPPAYFPPRYNYVDTPLIPGELRVISGQLRYMMPRLTDANQSPTPTQSQYQTVPSASTPTPAQREDSGLQTAPASFATVKEFASSVWRLSLFNHGASGSISLRVTVTDYRDVTGNNTIGGIGVGFFGTLTDASGFGSATYPYKQVKVEVSGTGSNQYRLHSYIC